MTGERFMSCSWALGVAVSLASCSTRTEGAAVGTERGACYPNGTCNEGLSCFSNHCVRYDAGTSAMDGSDASVNGVGGGAIVNSDATDDGGSTDPAEAGVEDGKRDAVKDAALADPDVASIEERDVLADVGMSGGPIDVVDGAIVHDVADGAIGMDAEAAVVAPACIDDAPDVLELGPSCADGREAGEARCPGTDYGSLLLCDDFDYVPDFFSPVTVNHGSRAFACSPISPPFAYAFTVPKSDCPTTSGARYGVGSFANFSAQQQVRLATKVKLDATCANAPPNKEATIVEFVIGGSSYRYVYRIRLAGTVPFLEIRHEPQVGNPQIAMATRALPTDTWLTIAEELRDTTATLTIDGVVEATGSRGGVPPSALEYDEFYIGIDAPRGWSLCTISFDDLTLNKL